MEEREKRGGERELEEREWILNSLLDDDQSWVFNLIGFDLTINIAPFLSHLSTAHKNQAMAASGFFKFMEERERERGTEERGLEERENGFRILSPR